MAHQNLSKAQFALDQLMKIPGVKRTFTAPFFNEFTIELPRSARMINHDLLKDKIVGPFAARPVISRTDQARARLRYGNHNAR